jgi:hypothetical protein
MERTKQINRPHPSFRSRPRSPLDLLLHLGMAGISKVFRSRPGVWSLAALERLAKDKDAPWIQVTQHEVVLERLDPAFDGLRLVQISDFHIGTRLDVDMLCEAVASVNQLQPDIVAITGDFVTRQPQQYASDLVRVLRGLSPRQATLAVLGNHDHWSDPVVVRGVLRSAGVIDLSNSVWSFHHQQASLHFAGVDIMMEELDDLHRVMNHLPPLGAAILLAHEPDFAIKSAASGRFDLQLSGHSHGGQIRFPILGPIILPLHARRFPSGYYDVKGMHLYTNRGLGTADLRIRINCPSEITLLILHSKKT